LPAREPKPKAPISATVERVNNETKHIPANFREYVRKAIIRNETKAEAALNAEIKNGQNAAFYERQKAILPEVRAILPKLKPEKVWINHNGAQREVDGLTFDFDGFNLAVYRNPEGRNALWGVLERTSGGGLFSASYKTIDEAMTTALAALRTTGRERFQSHIDSYIKDYRKTPFNPKASETKAAKAQKPVAQTKTQTPTPKAQEAIATKTKAPIAQAEDATPKTLETTQAPKPAETTAQIAKPAERSLESVLSDVEKDIEAQTLPFVKSNLQTLSQAIKANDREAIQAIASEASQSERLQGVYNRAYEALELMPKAKPKTKAKAGESETIGYDDAVEQIKNYTRKYGANRVQASPQASGAALGSTAGIEQDENGNLTYNPAKGLAGALGGYAIGSKLNNRFNKPQAVINKNPQNLTRNANSAYSNALNQNRSITDRLFGVQERGASVNKIMGGEGASGISKTPLREAKRLAKGGTSNKLIHAKTGWFKDKDGKFKFEIDDSKMAINSATLAQMKLPDPIGKEWKLSDLVKHDELYAKYPSLKDIRIFPNKESGAAYTPKKNIIKFNAHEPDIKSIMIHEIQHAVQDTEGFASGGNLQTGRLLAFKDKYASPELKRYRAARAAGKLLRMGHDSEKEIMEAAREADVDAALIREFLNSKGDKIYQAARFKPAKTTEPTLSESMAYYDRIHGETEARNVETRIGMNAAERAKSYPPSTFDQKKTFVIHNPETAQSIDNVSRDVKINNETFRNEFIKEGKLNIDKFAKNAAPFRRLEYTADNFKKEFLNNKVKTPLGIANISDRQFEKLELKERTAFFGLIKPTLNDPLFISKSGKDVYFIKPFVSEDKHIFFLSVAKDNADNLRIASNYGLSPQQVARHILNDDIIYARRQRLTNPTAPTPSRSETIPETAPKVKEGKTLKTIAGLGFTTGLAAALFNLTPANNQLRKGNNERLFNQSAI
ncbi:MAG: hypothetical protein LBP89_06500, partial [Helicobacteraceae bacterium]|nr:hypothetical protein [Helicobacteraceae bacterium]